MAVDQPVVSTNLAEQWGANVRDRREHLELTQVDLAVLCAITQQTVSKIESGGMIPLDRLKIVLAQKLCTTPAALFPWPAMEKLVGKAS